MAFYKNLSGPQLVCTVSASPPSSVAPPGGTDVKRDPDGGTLMLVGDPDVKEGALK